MPRFPNSDALCEHIRRESDTVLLSFSRGKDSIAAYVKLRKHGFRIVPVHYYLVPGLSFIEESLRYYEQVFGTHIYQLPAPALYTMWNEFVYQPPERCRHIENARQRARRFVIWTPPTASSTSVSASRTGRKRKSFCAS